MSELSAGERNSVHHSPGISRPLMKRWAWPPRTSVELVRLANGSLVYRDTSGAPGCSKSGPTAQLETSSAAQSDATTTGHSFQNINRFPTGPPAPHPCNVDVSLTLRKALPFRNWKFLPTNQLSYFLPQCVLFDT